MIHASVELVEAMRGVGGDEGAESSQPHARPACDSKGNLACVWGWTAKRLESTPLAPEHTELGNINCPACLRLMRLATDPVRYDFLRERGLVPELPLVSG